MLAKFAKLKKGKKPMKPTMTEKSMRDCPQMVKQGPGAKQGKMKKKGMMNNG